MALADVHTQIRNYIAIAAMLCISWFVSHQFGSTLHEFVSQSGEHGETLVVLCLIVMVFTMGFIVYELAKPTFIPSFVLSIFFGIVTQDALTHLVEHTTVLFTLITIGAILILFGGGLETPFRKFRQLIGPILSLALIGTLINAFLVSSLLVAVSQWIQIDLPLPVIVLLGAAIASTDPAAIIPSFESLLFRKPRVKHIAISESAINDVVGAVLVTLFLTLLVTQEFAPLSVVDAYKQLLRIENLLLIAQMIIVGLGVGLAGYLILLLWSKRKGKVLSESGSDAALFLAMPLFSYSMASILGGEGFLAVFITGLLFRIGTQFRDAEHYFHNTIEAFMKPIIYMMLGALVDPMALWAVADVGIIVGLLFMFVLRPLIVFLTLTPFCYLGTHCMSRKELIFLCFVRETGVIPAALLITIFVAGVPGSATMMAIGLWVILLTLIIEPPLTPLIARKLGIATLRMPGPTREHEGPVAVLCSRGFSFANRLETVVEWAQQHKVENIALLHCPEDKYSPDYIEQVRQRAELLFDVFNQKLSNEGKKELHFEFLGGPGMLQDNIEKLIAEGDVSIIFVGARMLDYRLEDVKQLDVPFYFMP